jgi:hypothetical protein
LDQHPSRGVHFLRLHRVPAPLEETESWPGKQRQRAQYGWQRQVPHQFLESKPFRARSASKPHGFKLSSSTLFQVRQQSPRLVKVERLTKIGLDGGRLETGNSLAVANKALNQHSSRRWRGYIVRLSLCCNKVRSVLTSCNRCVSSLVCSFRMVWLE